MIIHFLRNRAIPGLAHRLRARSGFRVQTSAVATGLHSGSPVYWAQTSDGQLMMANGIDRMLKWDGYAPTFQTVGVSPPAAGPVMAFSGIGSIQGDYYAYVRFLDERGNPSNLSPISGPVTARGNAKVTYTGVPAPSESKVVRRQILRNTAGQAVVFAVDVDTEDLGSSTFVSTNSDSDLTALINGGQAVALFDPVSGESLSDRYGLPPDHKPFIAHNNDRMFAAGHVVYDQGHCEVANGSAQVQGRGTSWKRTFANRRLSVFGAKEAYKIVSVNESTQVLTLDRPYRDASNKFALYAIAPYPAERRLVYYSEAGLPDSWPAANALAIQEDNDEITGLMSLNSYVYLLERMHVYRHTFKDDPATDGAFYPSMSRGCVSPRCYAIAEDTAYILDRKGVYSFDGGGGAEPISTSIQDLFRLDRSDLKVNWDASRFFHAAAFPGQETVRFFVSLSGERYPRHALAYSYRQRSWWLEEYWMPVAASCNSFLDVERVLVGGDRSDVYVMEAGPLDGVKASQGTLRGLVTGAGLASLEDAEASFVGPLEGVPVAIVSGRGKGQVRRIASHTGTKINLLTPWLVRPSTSGDDQSVYQIGGIKWRWLSGWHRYVPVEQDNVRIIQLMFRPLLVECFLEVSLYEDHAITPTPMGYDYDSAPVSCRKGKSEIVVDMASEHRDGFAQIRFDGGEELYSNSPDVLAVELQGFSTFVSPEIHQVIVGGVTGG